MPRQAQKPKNRNRGEEAENRGSGDIALQREAFQEWGVIGDNQPCRENQSQTNTNVNTGAYRRVAKDVEPSITRKMWTYLHEVLASQGASIRLTGIYGDGCVTPPTTAG